MAAPDSISPPMNRASPNSAGFSNRPLIANELWESVKRQGNLTLLCPATPLAAEWGETATTLTLTDGQALTARLLVGADGRDSWVRNTAGLRADQHAVRRDGPGGQFRLRHIPIAASPANGFATMASSPGYRCRAITSRSYGRRPTRTRKNCFL